MVNFLVINKFLWTICAVFWQKKGTHQLFVGACELLWERSNYEECRICSCVRSWLTDRGRG